MNQQESYHDPYMEPQKVDLRIAQELLALDLLNGQRHSSSSFDKLRADEQSVYLADARAARRRLDMLAMGAAKRRAIQKADEALRGFGIGITREQLAIVVMATLEAHHAHLSYGNPDHEKAEFEQAQGITPEKPLYLVPRSEPVPFGNSHNCTGENCSSCRWADRQSDSGRDE
jgi:hypothetical protein